jgi:hypothetical protein
MHIEEKTELIRNMIRFQDGEVLGGDLIIYFGLLLRSIQYYKGNSDVENTLKFMSRCESMLDLNPLYEIKNND